MVYSVAPSTGIQPSQPRAESARRAWGLAAILAGGALAVRLWCFTGLIASDDVIYAHYARALAVGHYSLEANHLALRFGLLLPVAASYTLFGISEATTALVSLVASVASVVLVFFIARRQFGLPAGVIAAVLMASFPLSIRYGSILVPETIAELYILAAVCLYLRASESGRFTTATAAGITLGVAYLTRELAFFVALAVFMEAAWQRRWRLLFAIAFGSFLIVLGEHLYYWFAAGDPLLRLHAMAAHNQRPDAMSFREHPAWRFFRALPHLMLIPSLGFGLHSLAALALAALASFMLNIRRTALFLLWIVLPLFYLNFGTTSLKTYIAMPVGDRYLELIYPPLFVLSGALLALMLQKRHGRILTTAGVGFLAVSGIGCAYATRASGWRTADVVRLREMATTMKSESGSIVGFEGPSAWAWKGAIEVLNPTLLDSTSRHSCVVRPDSQGLPVCVAQP
jgi:4-amino-4-deoxy-L-arabinose transferase-like glycosyltransferase